MAWLAFSTSKNRFIVETRKPEPTRWWVLGRFMLCITNLKIRVFFLPLLQQFINSEKVSVMAHSYKIRVLIVLITIITFRTVAIAVGSLRF